jgi:hypothetical protein
MTAQLLQLLLLLLWSHTVDQHLLQRSLRVTTVRLLLLLGALVRCQTGLLLCQSQGTAGPTPQTSYTHPSSRDPALPLVSLTQAA